MEIQPYNSAQREAIVGLSLRAWDPVFASIEQAMGSDVFCEMYQPDWRVCQQKAVEAVCADKDADVWVALEREQVAGFAALRLHADDRTGEIYMIAVDPPFQRRGIAAALTAHSLEEFQKAGMTTAMVQTGGDPGHAPARRAYESSGFRPVPSVIYVKKL